MSNIVVVGAGASGLTTAICLAEAGHDVTVVARGFLDQTTSWVATAIWHLFWVKIDERVERWSVRALEELLKLTETPEAGVTLVRGIECVREGTSDANEFNAGTTEALWKKVVPSYEPLTLAELTQRLPVDYPIEDPANGRNLIGGYWIEVPIADMSVYLPYLTSRLEALGVLSVQRDIQSFAEVRNEYRPDWIVNCSGLGSRSLASDNKMLPVRGQVTRISKDGSILEYIADDFSPRGMTYILPRRDDIILGGSQEEGIESSEVNLDEAAAIIARCTALVPQVANAVVLETLAGVRPARESIRLEVDPVYNDLIHNYGHGGSGVSLSWGCADDVVDLVSDRAAVRRGA